jgi:hypothetical protein
MEKYIYDKLCTLCDKDSPYFQKIIEILNSENTFENKYFEKHHIIPRSIDKSLINDKNNIVCLSAYNHILIHYYYFKSSIDKSMKHKNKIMFIIVSKENSSKTRIENLTEDQVKTIAQIVETVKLNRIPMTKNQRENLKSSKPFICLNTGKIYTNMKYCMEELKISNIYLVLKGKLTQTKGYYFVFCDDERLEKYTNQEIIKQIEDQKTKLKNDKKKKSLSNTWKRNISIAHGGQKVLCLETNEVFETQAECCNKFKIPRSELCHYLKTKKHPINAEFHFIYMSDKGNVTNEEWIEKIKKFSKDENGSLHRYNARKVLCVETDKIYISVAEAVKRTGIKGIYQVCLNKSKTAGGFHWSYI